MKNLFVGLLLFGTIASIAAAFFGLYERVKYNRIAIDKMHERDEAIEQQLRAEEAKRHAEEMRIRAEDNQKEAEQERDVALNEAEASKAQAEEANRLRAEAEQAKETAEAARVKAEEAALKDREEKYAMADERDKAMAEYKVEKAELARAEKRRDDTLRKMNEANAEVVRIRELGEMATETVTFVGKFNNILFPSIDEGDDSFYQGLDRFAAAKDRQDRYEAIGFINRARDKYIRAQGQLEKLGPIEGVDLTREIVELAQESTNENIKSIGIIQDVLKDKLGPKALTSDEIRRKADEAAKGKERADRLLMEVCDNLLEVIDIYKKGFTKAQQTYIQDLKKNIGTRLGISAGEPSE